MFVLLLFLHCFIFILVLLLCYVSRSSLYCNIPSDLCTLFFLLLLLHCFIFILVLLLYCISTSSLYCSIPSDLCTLYLSCITSKLFYLYTCTVAMWCIQIITLLLYTFRLVYSVFVLLLLLHCFIFILVLLLCCVSRSSLYCNIPSDLCTLCLSCYYYYIALSLFLYCCYIVYLDHHFTVVYLQTCVLCICLVITSTLFYLYTCTVAMWCIQIITLLLYTFRLVYSVFVLLLLLHCFIFILVLLLCYVSRSSLYSNIPSYLCSPCLPCYYFYIVLSLYLYCCYLMYPDHHFTVVYLQTCVVRVSLLLLLHCFIFILVLLLCCVSRLSLYCNTFRLVSSVFVLLLFLHCFISILALLLCYVSRSSLYSNIPSYLCSLCLPCYYFYIVLSLYLYCCYAIYPDHHFTVIFLQTCILCVCLVIISTLFYLYTCIVVMLCI